MAANELNSEELIEAVERALQFRPNDGLVPPPGTVTKYELLPAEPDDNQFEPITSFAIRESGGYGPLTAEELKAFLREVTDRRRNPSITTDTIRRYTNDIPGFFEQLFRLRHRIIQIRACERDLTNFLKARFKQMIKALERGRALPKIHRQLRLSALFMLAIDYVGEAGPLTAENFQSILRDGLPVGATALQEQLLQQLKEVINRISDIEINEHRQNFHTISKNILKAINNILIEFMNGI